MSQASLTSLACPKTSPAACSPHFLCGRTLEHLSAYSLCRVATLRWDLLFKPSPCELDASCRCRPFQQTRPFPYGSSQTPEDLEDLENKEREALQEIEQVISDSKRRVNEATIGIFLIEPLMVPGRGRTYRSRFLSDLQKFLTRVEVLLVADETISFVRCGVPLFSQTVPCFAPDLVIVGKGLGCSLLLRETNLPRTPDVERLFANAFGLVASPPVLQQVCCVLRYFLTNKSWQLCRKQGKDMLRSLRKIAGVRARGVGHCLWIEDGLEKLPITACIHGRLLPRLDQNGRTIRSLVRGETKMMLHLSNSGELEAARSPHCALCGDQCRTGEVCISCRFCTRQYHRACIEDPVSSSSRKPQSYICACAAPLNRSHTTQA